MTGNIGVSYYKYWGKARKNKEGEYEYHLLVYHCLDVAAVGVALINNNSNILPSLSNITNVLNIDIESLIILLLCIHDFGKFSKTFQSKIPELQYLLQGCNRGKPGPLRHDTLAFTLWNTKYAEYFYNSEDIVSSSAIVSVLEVLIHTTAGHHGKPALLEQININDYFDDYDYASLEKFWGDILEIFEIHFLENSEILIALRNNEEAIKTLSWSLAGFITFSDWIGSNQSYFGLKPEPVPLGEYWKDALKNAKRAIDELGVYRAPVLNVYSLEEFLPVISKNPTPLQQYCDTCEIPDEPQLWILEDVTGAGKTESALILAARLLSKKLGNGIFIALPTMATSDAMYKRLSSQYLKLFIGNTKPSLVLAHGARHLSEGFRESFLTFTVEGDNMVIEKDASAALCNRWFSDTNKKALLADAGVGTIDQVIIGVLAARHQSLRLFGLQGKVLIVDEVHAYDSYQHRLLCSLIEHHSRNGGSIILLSATLPKDVRESFATAYLRGTGKRNFTNLVKDNYPLATRISSSTSLIEIELDTRSDLKRSITVQFEGEYNRIPVKLVAEAKAGKCCCWIRNTVTDAIKSYEEITAVYPAELVSLLHSRFTYADRMQKEGVLLQHFGPDSDASRRKGRIVIATQVIEQSLDVDFDVLVSDLAPMDYIIQRLGRLFRHKRDESGNRYEQDKRGIPVLIIYGPVPTIQPSKTWYSEVLSGASYVYVDHGVLWKTQQVIMSAGNKITLPGTIETPDGIRNLMNKVYGAEALETPSELQEKENEALGKSGAGDCMGRFNVLNFNEGYSPQSSTQWYEELQAPTRIGGAQATVYLARIQSNNLQPFEEGEYPWDLSAVKVRATLVKGSSFECDIEAMISVTKGNSRRFFEGDLIVPLRFENGIWAINANIEKKGLCRLMYSKERGFEVGKC